LVEDPKAIVRRLYRGVDGFDIPPTDEQAVRAARSSSVYGELMPTATLRLLEALELQPEDVFFDLGAGVGKVVLMAALSTPVRQAVGVELSARRIRRARIVAKRAVREGLVEPRRIRMCEADILGADLSAGTVFYTCATAFPWAFTAKIMRRIAKLRKPVTFVSTQVLDPHRAFTLDRVLRLDMSWRRRSKVYVYRVSPGGAAR
jgi:SAM-dependent methyltransferase